MLEYENLYKSLLEAHPNDPHAPDWRAYLEQSSLFEQSPQPAGGGVEQARREYAQLGLDTLPLQPGSKNPLSAGWQARQPHRMWRDAPKDANIGIRPGGETRAAIIDCDDKTTPGTLERAQAYLSGLGLDPGDYPLARGASGKGGHAYIRLEGDLPGNYRKLDPKIGAGEFRYGPGSFVVAPPSMVGSVTYSLLAGDFHNLPTIATSDVLPLLGNRNFDDTETRAAIPRRAMALLSGRQAADRSVAEQSLITSLVNAGFTFERVLSLFRSYPCSGKFSELNQKSPKNAERWLRRSYDQAKEWAESHVSLNRQLAEQAIEWALYRPWPGRTGAVDRSVFVAHASLAHRAAQLTYAASVRSLAELAGCNYITAGKASHRLIKSNLLSLETKAAGDCASVYTLDPENLPDSERDQVGQTCTLPHIVFERKCTSLPQVDAFRYKGLGRVSAEIYALLLQNPGLCAKEIAERTGRHRRTIERALRKMSDIRDSLTGEIIRMVASEGGKWFAIEVDLDQVADVIGTAGTGERQRAQHARDRARYRAEIGRRREV